MTISIRNSDGTERPLTDAEISELQALLGVTPTPTEVPPYISVLPAINAAVAGALVTWSAGDATGVPEPVLSYQLLKNGALVATSSGTYSSTVAGDVLIVRITANNGVSPEASGISEAVTVTAATSAPAITTVPTISPNQAGAPVTWTAAVASGSPTPTITYSLRKNGTQVATASGTYSATVAGDVLTLVTTASNGVGTPATNTAGPITVGSQALKKIIWDTDLDSDCDDITATALLIGLIDESGETLIGSSIASNNDYAAPCMRTLLDYAGRTSSTAPIGAYKGNAILGGSSSPYTQQVAARFGHTETRAAYPDAVPSMVTMLTAAADKSIKLIIGGTCTNVAALITANPALVTAKVSSIHVMGGRFNGSTLGENNIAYDIPAANVVASFNGCPKTWAGYEIGDTVNTRINPAAEPLLDPYRYGWGLYFETSNPVGTPESYRPSWDLMAVLHAIKGEAGVFSTSVPGDVSFASGTSATTFTPNSSGSNYYLTKTGTDAQIAALCTSYIDAFTVRYHPVDTTPSDFDLGSQANATGGQVYPSATVTIAGLFGGGPAAVSVAGGEYRKNGGAWGTTASTVTNGDTLQVRGTASATAEATVTVSLTVGTKTKTYPIVTKAASFAYDTDAQALFARHTNQWNDTQKNAANNFIVGAKSSGVWDTLDVFMLTAGSAGDAQRATRNFKGDVNNGTVTGTGVFNANGWQGNGTSGYIDPAYVFATANSGSMGCYSLTESQSPNAEMGSANNNLALRTATDIAAYRINSAAGSTAASTSSLGHFITSRLTSTEQKLYRNGAIVATGSAASATPDTASIRFGGRGGSVSYSARVLPVFHAGKGMTDAQISSLNSLVTSLLTGFGVI